MLKSISSSSDFLAFQKSEESFLGPALLKRLHSSKYGSALHKIRKVDALFVPLSLCNTLDILPFMIGVTISLVIYCFNGFLILIIHQALLPTMISSFALLVMTLIFLIYILQIIIRRLLRISLKITKS